MSLCVEIPISVFGSSLQFLTNGLLYGIVESDMEEDGRVVAVRNDRAEVEVVPGEACKRCGASGFCNWGGKKVKLVTARNEAGAEAGDKVTVRTPEKGRFGSAALVFGLPALLMVAGVIAGSLLWNDTWAAILAGIGLATGLAIVKTVDLMAGRSGKRLPVIVRVLAEDNKGGKDESMADSSAGRSDGDDVR